MNELSGSVVVAGIEDAWRAIQAHHPDVPDAVVVVGRGARGSRELKLGHWSASRWRRVRGTAVGEVFVAAEIMKPGPPRQLFGSERSREKRVLSTLLHEAAHALAYARDIRDTSRQGRYHNARYKLLAEEVGLVVAKDDKFGWTTTELRRGTGAKYRDQLRPLRGALAGYCDMPVPARPVPVPGEPGADGDLLSPAPDAPSPAGEAAVPPKKGLQKLVCACEPTRVSYMTRAQLSRGPLWCGVCESAFVLV